MRSAIKLEMKKNDNETWTHGLSTKEAVGRLRIYGPNIITRKKKISAAKILFNQFTDFMIIVLLASTAISLFLGDITEALAIIAIVLLNAIMGFVQEFRSEKSIEALRNLASPTANVIRDGVIKNINAEGIVPGDIVILGAGGRVPADCILLQSNNIHADESILTGESIPAEKTSVGRYSESDTQAEKNNCVYMGTGITAGAGKAVVISTGMNTEMGKIADMIQNIEDEQTPLQNRLEHLGKYIVYGCLGICSVVAVTGILRGEAVFTMFLSGVSLAVAAIPEGLPAIVTVALAIGVQKMVKKNALVRKLPAVETLGCASVICSDKTGTLTENKMTVREIYSDGKSYYLSGTGYETEGEITCNGKNVNIKDNEVLKVMFEAGVLCNNANTAKKTNKGKQPLVRLFRQKKDDITVIGDPTEGAILIASGKAGITKETLNPLYERIDEIPFDSDRKCMSVICRNRKGERFVFSKGAPDVIIQKCSRYYSHRGIYAMQKKDRDEVLRINDGMGDKALRVLGFAFKKIDSKQSYIKEKMEDDLIFLGLMGMMDPPRKEVIDSIRKCNIAGIKTVMITGDHQRTANAIAAELEILKDGDQSITGSELEDMTEAELLRKCENVSVYSRVSPRHKLRIVRALKEKGHVVAMTGDGVNDAPAVKEADIGVAMGISGTDVTKEASSMILTDDNFSTIVSAVEEGRIVYSNIRKFIRYMLSCNIGEVLTMFIGAALMLPIPLLPIQLLWVNLVTDGLPAIALGFEPPEKDIMMYPPRAENESIFSRGLAKKIIFRGIFIGIGTLAVFWSIHCFTGDIRLARTAAFVTLCVMQLIYVFECKSETKTIFEIPVLSNIWLVIAVIISLIMLLGVVYIPACQGIFKTSAPGLNEWLLVAGFSALGPALASMYKKRRIKS